MAVTGHRLKIILKDYETELHSVEEYVGGYKYFYCRLLNGETFAFKRSRILKVLHRARGEWTPVHLRNKKAQTKIHVTTFEDGKPVDTVKQG